MSSFAYSVAIKLSVANLASQGVKLLAADLMRAHGAATNLQTKLSALKMIAVGYGMEKAGQGILGFLGKAIEGSKEYTHQIALMNAAGMSHLEIAQSTANAWKTSQSVITSTAADNLRVLRELRSVFYGRMDEAYSALPMVQRTAAVIQSQTGREDHDLAFAMIKYAEDTSKGKLTSAALEKALNWESKGLIAFGGTLNANDYLMAAKYAKTSALQMSDEYKYLVLPGIMQELKSKGGGASSAGNITEAMRRMIVGGQIAQKDIQSWLDAGLIHRDRLVKNKHGTGYKLTPGAVIGSEMPDFDPYQWVKRYGEAGVHRLMVMRHLTEDQAVTALTSQVNKAFGIQTLILKSAQIARNGDLIKSTPNGYQAYQELLKKDPIAAHQAMQAQWQNLTDQIGWQVLPKLVPLMVKFADGLNLISTWMQNHPVATSTLVIGLGVLGVALDLAGKALMAAGIIRFLGLAPMLASAITGLGAASAAAGGAAGVGGLLAVLTGPLGLTVAAIAATAAIGGLIYSLANHSDEQKSKSRSGEDIGLHRGNNPLLWVQDTSGKGGNLGHWIGKGSGAANSMHTGADGKLYSTPAAGMRINPAYMPDRALPYIAPPKPPQITVNVNNKLDKNGLTTAIADEMGRRMGKPNTGSTTFNGAQALPSVGVIR